MIDSTHPIAPGQIWSYKTRPHEQSSRLIISKVETGSKLIGIVHIQVIGLRIRNPKAPNGLTETIGHLPYEIIALRNSLSGLDSSNGVIAPFEAGYTQWRAAFDNGTAGVWTIPVADAITAMEASFAS